MPSKTDFNVTPYYDDFNESKDFHRVMYRPAFAVQARELTATQSLLQNQIEKIGDHFFKHGAMVIPGQVSTDLNYFAVKLTSFTGTLSLYKDNTLTGSSSGVVADVVDFVATDGTDPDTLFVKYRNSGTNNDSEKFTDGETITSGQTAGSTAVVSTCTVGSAVYIDAGTYYINGFFVNVDSQSLVLEKYSNQPSYRVGLTITETFVTSTDDTSLLDNATGSSNENATGAHRFKIDLTLAKLALTSTADASFVELMRITDGRVQNMVETTEYSFLEDTLARRTFDESGDYTVKNFDLDIREHLLSGTNRGIYTAAKISDDGNVADESKLALGFSQGTAYVKGYEIRKIGTTYVDINKARDFETDSGITTRFNIGSFVNVTNVFGTPDISFVSGDVEAFKTLRLVDTAHGTRGTVFGTSLAHVFDIGRAKSRAFEYNSGNAASPDSGASSHLSSGSVADVIFKHFLFDIEMFSHVNITGKMSGALTDGDILTGGTSGATGIVESISAEGSATITGATSADPVVVTCSGGHNFLEGQQIIIAGVSGITDINTTHTVKDPTATTFKLFTAQAAASTTPAGVDGSGYSSFSGSGGTAKHTTIVLTDVQGEFSPGEAVTAPTNSRTGTIQFDSFGCKGFQQKEFNQVKGISMAGSPTYTANVSLDSIFGEHKTLTGNIAVANNATAVVGKGTRFTSELKIGDSITFTDNANSTVTRLVEAINSDTSLELTAAVGGSDVTTAAPFTRRRTKLREAGKNIAIAPLPYSVVKTLLTTDNESVSDTSFKIRKQFTKTLAANGTASINAGTNEIFTAFDDKDFAVSIMSTGDGGTGAAGDVISLSTANDFTLGGTPTGKTLTINLGTGYNGHKIKVLATLSTSEVAAKTKTDTAGTKTVDTLALVKKDISLGKTDIYKLNSVFMAADFSTAASASDTDITSRFNLDTGQRDNFYDIGRLKLKSGAATPTGRLLVNFDYFEHGAGNFFSVDSYTGFDYGSIPAYTSDVSGATYNLRDVLDFRSSVVATSTIGSGGNDRTYASGSIEVMKIGSDVTADLEYYLHKKARVYITSQGKFKVVEGPSSLNPVYGETLKNSMHLYDLNIPAFTFNTADIGIKAIDNRRFTMRDIGGLAKRIENVEYYTQLSLLESAATGMQIQDADGFDRFKNGIIVDNFTGHGIGNPRDNDYSVSMDMAAGELRPACHSDNVNLIESDNLLANSGVMSSAGYAINSTAADAIRTTNGYQLTGDLITLPYTSESYITQGFASTTVNLQPYETISYVGRMKISPDQDEWKDTETLPDMTVSIPGTFDTMQAIAAENPAALGIGTVWNEWNNNWSGVDVAGSENQTVDTSSVTTGGNWFWGGGTTTTTTNTTNTIDVQQVNNRTRTGIRTGLVPGGLQTQSLGNRVVQVAFAPFMRARDITFTANGLKPSTRFYPFFDGVDVSTFTKPSGGSYNGSLLSDSTGKVTGVFSLIDPNTGFEVTNTTQLDTSPAKQKFRTGTRTFRLTTSSTDSRSANLTSSAEADYTARGLLETVQKTVTSSREGRIERTTVNQSSVVNGSIGTRIVSEETAVESVTDPGVFPFFGFGWFDPVCQSFLVDQADGIYITDLDLFFQTKDSAIPVTVQIMTMENGYPTSIQVPFATATVAAADISISADASESTKFTFEAPIFLNPYTEYAFRVMSSSKKYEMYTARMGQTTLDSARLISKQPYLGSMFKSQNSTTWTAEQNEDVKFTINRAKFTTGTTGTVTLVNDTLTTKVLPLNPITTIAGILDEALDTSETTITLEDTSNFPSAGTILIGSEQITYTGKSGNDLTGCTRGANWHNCCNRK